MRSWLAAVLRLTADHLVPPKTTAHPRYDMVQTIVNGKRLNVRTVDALADALAKERSRQSMKYTGR